MSNSFRNSPKRKAALAAVTGLCLVATACGSSGPKASTTSTTSSASTSTTSTSSTTTSTTTTTVPVVSLSGEQTVLSPIGLHVRARPSKSGAILGTAAQGVVLQLLGHTAKGGGWYKVQGSTVTGWITDDPAYSAKGRFGYYSSPPFNLLYPAGWTQTGSPGTGVTFSSPNPPERVVVTSAAKKAKLHSFRQGAGVSISGSQQVVACGVTAELYTFTTPTPGRELADVVVPTAAHHYIGIRATLKAPKQLKTVLDFVNSLSFPSTVCLGPPPKAKSVKTPHASHKATTTTKPTTGTTTKRT